jgi:hypothetical protein
MDSSDEWKSDDDRDLDLHMENQSLELELELKGGIMDKRDDIDPQIHNAFLRSVLAFEEMDAEPKISIKSIFPDTFEFPPVNSLGKKELSKKLDEIIEILERHSIVLGFTADLPDKVIYEYLVNDFIPQEKTFNENCTGLTQVVDGCDGYCPDCFQNSYCEVSREIGWEEEERQDT